MEPNLSRLASQTTDFQFGVGELFAASVDAVGSILSRYFS